MKKKTQRVHYIDAEDEGLYLRARMIALGYKGHGSVTRFARDLGVTRQTLYDIFAGKYALTREVAEKLNGLETNQLMIAAWKICAEVKK